VEYMIVAGTSGEYMIMDVVLMGNFFYLAPSYELLAWQMADSYIMCPEVPGCLCLARSTQGIKWNNNHKE